MDIICPIFGQLSVHEWKLMTLSQYLTVFPSHFNNILLKSFRLLPNLMINCDILQKLTRFHKTNNISWHFRVILLCFCSVWMYFVDFWYFWKMIAKFWFHSNRFEILKFQTWGWQKLKKWIMQLPNISWS
jgi:hypothetical protein